jgi:hypothetical protein
MPDRPRPLRGQVLKQGAAERYVDHLDATADPENRQLALPGRRDQRELEQDPLAAGRLVLR